MRIGIMGAMHEEVHLLTEALQNHECVNFEGGVNIILAS